MSTLKKIFLILFAGGFIGTCIAVSLGKITISESWFSVRTLQISLGCIVSVLLFLYIQPNRADTSPKAKELLIRSRMLVISSFLIFLWGVLSQPVVPVNVSFEGVAKTTDVMAVKRDVQKTNESIALGNANSLSYQKRQEQGEKTLLQEVKDGNKKVIELDLDERVRQEATSEQIADVANDLKKVSVGVDDVKKIDHAIPVVTSVSTVVISEKIRVFGILIIVVLIVASFSVSFSSKVSTKIPVKITRKVVPLALLTIGSIIYCFPLLINTMPSISEKKLIPEKIVVKKEEKSIIDTVSKKEQPQEQKPEVGIQQPSVDSVTRKDTAVVAVEVVAPKTEKKNKKKKGNQRIIVSRKPGKRNFDE